MWRTARVIAALAGLVIPAGGLLIPAAAAAAPAAQSGTIVLTGQPAWSTLGDDLTFRLGIHAATTSNLEVRAQVHSAVLSRIAFERTLDGDRLGTVLGSHSSAVDAMPVAGTDRLLTLGLQDPAAASDSNRLRLTIPASGIAAVFPVEIELRNPESGTVVDSFVSDIVVVRRRNATETPNAPLHVAWLWRIATPPVSSGTAANGVVRLVPSLTNVVAPGGRLGRLATALGQSGGIPITLAPNPDTVDALRSAAGTDPQAETVLDAIRNAAKSEPVLASPYTTVDGPSLMHGGLATAFDTVITTGRTALETGLGVAIDGSIASPQPIDAPALARLRDQGGATRLIVDPDTLEPANSVDQFTPAHPFRLDAPGAGSFDAVEINSTASDLLVRNGSAALRAQQLLASLSVVALEQPNRARGVVINTPLLWDPDPARVGAVLAGLRGHPLLQGSTVADLFASIQAATLKGKPYTRGLAPALAPAAPVTPAAYSDASKRVDGLASMIGADEPTVSHLRHELLLSLAARVPGTGAAVSAARLRGITSAVSEITGKIVAPSSRTVTLTSRRASVPLSIENNSGRPLKVRVKLASQKLNFPQGSGRTIELAPGNKTTAFDVEARASGTFPVLVTLTSPDGGLVIQRSRYTVRSSVVSGVGLILTISAVLFLAAWWLTHWRRSRRPRPAAPVS